MVRTGHNLFLEEPAALLARFQLQFLNLEQPLFAVRARVGRKQRRLDCARSLRSARALYEGWEADLHVLG